MKEKHFAPIYMDGKKDPVTLYPKSLRGRFRELKVVQPDVEGELHHPISVRMNKSELKVISRSLVFDTNRGSSAGEEHWSVRVSERLQDFHNRPLVVIGCLIN